MPGGRSWTSERLPQRRSWPDARIVVPAAAFTTTRRSAAPELERPALIQLRLRALWGVSARAEVLRAMLADGYRFLGISEVAAAAAFGKDAVAEALENLQRGGLLEEAGPRNLRMFRLGRTSDLVALVGREQSCSARATLRRILVGGRDRCGRTIREDEKWQSAWWWRAEIK